MNPIQSDPLSSEMDSAPLLSTVTIDESANARGKLFSTGGWISAFFIIGVEMAERFAYYGVSTNLITYLTGPLGESTATAASNVNLWSGMSLLLPIPLGLVADFWVGRYPTIILASVLYVLGLGMLTYSAVSPALRPQQSGDGTFATPSTFQTAFFFVSLYVVSFAQGGHKPCVQAFGADQFDDNDVVERKSKSSFFNWWYFGMCFSTVFTVAGLSYVQDNIGWGFGFGIPCASMAFALLIFLLGTKTYRFPTRMNQNHLPESEEKGSNVRVVMKLFPTWATCLIYAVVYSQSGTFFTKQGGTIDRRIGETFEVPPAALQTFISLSIVISIPIYDRVIIPILRKLTDTHSGITMLQRIGTGMFLSVISMVAAALVEIKRLKTIEENDLIDSPEIMIPMSLWWLVPQYIIYGMADTFTMVGLQEFFYDQVPDGLRSLGLALYLSIFGIGSFMSSALVSAIDNLSRRGGGDSWFSDNLNRAHLDYFYWLLAGLSAVQFIIYIFLSKFYVYKKKNT